MDPNSLRRLPLNFKGALISQSVSPCLEVLHFLKTNELIMQRKKQYERRRKKSCLPSAKPRFKRSPVSARCSMSPSQSTCVADFQVWAACPHFLLIVPQREAANLRDLHRDLQQVT